MHVGCMKSSELLFEGKQQESEVSQKYCKTDTITTKAENVILFQIASGLNISPTRNDPLANSAYSSSVAINTAISPPFDGKSRISVRKEDHATGFRVWKPEHSSAKVKLAPSRTRINTEVCSLLIYLSNIQFNAKFSDHRFDTFNYQR
mgnify:FL=1